jgi:hypothetical protein
LKFNKLLTSESQIDNIEDEMLRMRFINITIEALSDGAAGKLICKSEKVRAFKDENGSSS